MLTQRSVILAALFSCVVSTAMAADATTTTDITTPLHDAKPGPLQSPVTLARDAVEVSASQDSSNVSLQLSYGATGHELDPKFEAGVAKTSTYTAASLILKAPVDKKNDSSTELASLDGLANAFTATLKVNHTLLSRRSPTDAELAQFCDPDADSDKPAVNGAKPACDLGILHKTLSSDQYAKVHDLFFSANQWNWGGSLTVGTQNYEYLQEASVNKTTQRHTPWSAALFGALYRYRVGLLTASFTYQDSYKAGTNGTNCPSSTTGGVVSCVSDPIGAPKKSESDIVSLEFRRSGWQVLGKPVAIAPAVNYDVHGSVFGIEIPIYLVANDKGQLTGGLKAGWRDDRGGLTVGLFIGTPFSLSPNK